MLKLSHEIDVFVPATDNEGNALDFQPSIMDVIEIVGGATVVPATGLWSDSKHLYTDNMQVTQFNTDSLENSDMWFNLYALIDNIFTIGKQEAVSVKVDGILYILENAGEFVALVKQVQETASVN